MLIDYWWQLSLLALISYLMGNFCAAVVISNKFIHKDIREMGSKNAGTTNMTRVFGIKYGAATLLVDFLKGFICVIGGKIVFTLIGGADVGIFASYFAGLAVILGHNYPALFGFKGGKGFATGIGVFIVVNPIFTFMLLIVGVIFLLIVDRMSVFALTFFAVQSIYLTIVHLQNYWWISFFACLYLILAIIAHWPNIIRLVHGEEKPLEIIERLRKIKQNI